MKVNNLEIIYGLASRAKPYGIAKSFSKYEIDLKQINKLGITEFDGAESYPWLNADISYLNENNKTKFYTKISYQNISNLDIHLDKFRKSIQEKRLKGIYFHSTLKTNKDFLNLNKFCETIKEKNLIPGVSLYKSKEVIDLQKQKIIPQIVQIPLNPSTKINQNIKKFKQTNFIARSIFLQSAYFNPIKISKNISNLLKLHISKIGEVGKFYNYSLEESLLAYAITKANNLNFKGIILSTSSIKRLENQLNFASKIFEKDYFKKIDNAIYSFSEKLSDPRLW